MNISFNDLLIKKLWEKKSITKTQHINEKELHIWRSKISNNLKNLDYYWRSLSKDEQIRAKEFYFSKDKINYIISRGILRNIIASYIGICPIEVQFEYTEYGKPYLEKKDNYKIINFNFSHSNDCFIVGLVKNIDIGIDIEFCDDNCDLENMAKYLCSIVEYNKLKKFKINERYHYFYNLWTRKEAIVKLLGKGLHLDLRKINLNSLLQEELTQLSYVFNNDSLKLNIFIRTFFAYDGYCSAFATSEMLNRILYFDYLQ